MASKQTFKKHCLAIAIAQCLTVPVSQATTWNLSQDSACEFSDAIVAANTNQASGGCSAGSASQRDVINLESDFSFTQASSQRGNALNFVTSDITINGNGHTLTRDAYSAFRFIGVIGSNADLSLNNATLTGGYLYGYNGGAIYVGTAATLEMQNVTLTSNNVTTNNGGAGVLGAGGIGGALFSRGTVHMEDCTISNNRATSGGGVYTGYQNDSNSSLTIVNSSISHNRSGRQGAGIMGRKPVYLGIFRSVISSNVSLTNDGGGIHLNLPSVAKIQNSTISNNSAAKDGGGIHISGSTSVTITNTTIASNYASERAGGIFTFSTSFLNLNNTLVSGNQANDAASESLLQGIAMNVTSNLFGDDSKSISEAFGGSAISTSENILAFNKRLSTIIQTSLSNNGGKTRNHALQSNSIARDAGNQQNCPPFDQRGQARDDGQCDIGAFEFGPNDEEACFVTSTRSGKIVTFCL